MKIVIGFDGSENSRKAVNFLGNFCHTMTEIFIVNIIELQQATLNTTEQYFLTKAKILKILEEETRKIRNEICKEKSDKIEIDIKIIESNRIAPAIIDFAKAIEADLIVVGSRGLGQIKRAFLGSVSSELIEKSPFPVLVVK
ncbi:universal stress protein [Sulfolobus islandicus]|uniref:UspA domain protein n=1 Tax=Saccharolobus islandicus (strain HVE10/4) TaxID=930943 RepID=F0NK12_SACI0|nr:universal stress protein [Sulfolobus islandicus]ADX82328.1 UspA domain protein [Sulfolobus islandicus HVE10/4]WCM36361.1 universal stress protein [Sulfolobus islandicus]